MLFVSIRQAICIDRRAYKFNRSRWYITSTIPTVVVTMLVRNKWNILKSIRPKRPSRNKSIISRMERHEWSFNWKLNLNESCKLFRSKAMHNQVNIIYNNRNTNANTTATIHQQQQNGKMDMDDDLVLSSCVCGVTGEWTMAITLSCGYNSV